MDGWILRAHGFSESGNHLMISADTTTARVKALVFPRYVLSLPGTASQRSRRQAGHGMANLSTYRVGGRRRRS